MKFVLVYIIFYYIVIYFPSVTVNGSKEYGQITADLYSYHADSVTGS